jgi:hypothetical protein
MPRKTAENGEIAAKNPQRGASGTRLRALAEASAPAELIERLLSLRFAVRRASMDGPLATLATSHPRSSRIHAWWVAK